MVRQGYVMLVSTQNRFEEKKKELFKETIRGGTNSQLLGEVSTFNACIQD